MLPFHKFGGVKGLVLNGGGVLGVAHIGAIKELYQNDMYEYEYYAGASVGGLIAAAMSLGAKYKYLEDMIFHMDFTKFMDETSYDAQIVDVSRLIWRYGWYKGVALEEFYRKIIYELCGDADITMSEAYKKTGKFLLLTAYRANDQKTVSITHLTYPHMPLYKAIKYGSTYPFFFATETISSQDMAKYTGQPCPVDIIFADGGILNNYPIKLLAEHIPLDEIIGLHLSSTDEMKATDTSIPPPPKNVITYALGMANAMRTQAMSVHISSAAWERTIAIPIGNMSSMNFNLTTEEKRDLFLTGINAVKSYYNVI